MKNRFQEKIFLYPSLFILWRNNIGFIILWGGSIIMKHFYCRFASYYFEKFKTFKKIAKFVMFSLYPSLFYQKFSLIWPMFIGQIGILFTPDSYILPCSFCGEITLIL